MTELTYHIIDRRALCTYLDPNDRFGQFTVRYVHPLISLTV